MIITTEEVKKEVEDCGYIFLGENCDNKRRKRVIIQDLNGFKYETDFYRFKTMKNPDFVNKYNPFTLENISLWLELNNKNFKLCENNNYKGTHQKLFFKCLSKDCEEIFEASWNHVHTMGSECPYCVGQKIGSKNNLKFLRSDLLKEWNYLKNEFNPEDVSVFSPKKAWWICSFCKHQWLCAIYSRTKNNTGCPNCSSSKGEQRIHDWVTSNINFLKNKGLLEYVPQKKFLDCINKKPLPFDFGLKYLNNWILIEYQGEQHFREVSYFGGEEGFKKRITNDRIKKEYCKRNKYILIIISYLDLNNIEKILLENLPIDK